MKRKPALPSLLTRAGCCLLITLGLTLAAPTASLAEQTEQGNVISTVEESAKVVRYVVDFLCSEIP